MAVVANAQVRPAALAGTVRDSGGLPVPLAQLTLLGIRALSDTAGRFLFTEIPPGIATLAVRRLGFAPSTLAIELVAGRKDSVFVVLALLPQELSGVNTEATSRLAVYLADFYRHRRGGSTGHFFERKEIDASNVHNISDLMRRVPGLRLLPDRSGRVQLRMGRSMGGRDCPPDFWIDGVRAPLLNVDDIPLDDVEAMEIYSGPAGVPPEMNSRLGNPGCGAIVIWTRMPG
jgi:hypothetical protein